MNFDVDLRAVVGATAALAFWRLEQTYEDSPRYVELRYLIPLEIVAGRFRHVYRVARAFGEVLASRQTRGDQRVRSPACHADPESACSPIGGGLTHPQTDMISRGIGLRLQFTSAGKRSGRARKVDAKSVLEEREKREQQNSEQEGAHSHLPYDALLVPGDGKWPASAFATLATSSTALLLLIPARHARRIHFGRS